jgi:putative transcriptional regulator
MRPNEEVTNTVQYARKENGITQEQLADAVGVTRQTIISIEKGNYIPSVLLALKIAIFFNIAVEELFTVSRKT